MQKLCHLQSWSRLLYRVYPYETGYLYRKQTFIVWKWYKILYSKCCPSLAVHFSHLSHNLWMLLKKTAGFWWWTSHQAIFVIGEELLGKCVSHRCKQVLMARTRVWWVSCMSWATFSQLSTSNVSRTHFVCVPRGLPFWDISLVFASELTAS